LGGLPVCHVSLCRSRSHRPQFALAHDQRHGSADHVLDAIPRATACQRQQTRRKRQQGGRIWNRESSGPPTRRQDIMRWQRKADGIDHAARGTVKHSESISARVTRSMAIDSMLAETIQPTMILRINPRRTLRRHMFNETIAFMSGRTALEYVAHTMDPIPISVKRSQAATSVQTTRAKAIIGACARSLLSEYIVLFA